ncbi:SNF2 family N-terminal domain-containing protein [Microdochium trichocladiopsis]|uniref:SNF2 family N-terminal domain-containing protein n=1 Tax=Microdochium trichocladiopsis TaxID=1682393 RepID=A0A9P8Y9V7_9PEZI|nr:SNF2 family N-terminal domain-containing protein [Microdochium trichocladiopsis]KAH7033440.1 SNF2 family N-terminal domain-containing protein [Microdochium trichocladiopsis]
MDGAILPRRSSRQSLPLTSEPIAKRGRGRPSKEVIASETASASTTPSESVSEAEYSTPATSIAVTPAASTSGLPTAGTKRTRGQLVVQLPPVDPNAFTLPKRALKPNNKTLLAESEDDEFDYGSSSDAILARRLQREEYAKADTGVSSSEQISATDLVRPQPTRRRSTRTTRLAIADSEDDLSINVIDKKGKGKAVSKAVAKPSRASQTRGKVENSIAASELDDEDVPLSVSAPARKKQKIQQPDSDDELTSLPDDFEDPFLTSDGDQSYMSLSEAEVTADDGSDPEAPAGGMARIAANRRAFRRPQARLQNRAQRDRARLEKHHPQLKTMWTDLENMPILTAGKAEQPKTISRQMKPFQLEGLAWMRAMETTKWRGGLLGDEMGLGKTIQAVSLIMSDYPAKTPTLVLVPPVALMQWTAEIESYTGGLLKTLVFHGTNSKAKGLSVKELKQYDVLMMSYNTLESLYRKQEKGFKRKDGMVKERSAVHQIMFHRVILDEAHCIKTRTTMTAKACFALKVEYRWCLTGTPLQNRIGEFFSLIRFLNMRPFAEYFCKQCPCAQLEWSMGDDGKCTHCQHHSMGHVSVFNQELLNPIQKYGNRGEGNVAFQKLRLMTNRIMLRRLKKDHTDSMELPVKEIYVDRQFFGEVENDFANSIMSSGQRKFDTYVAQGVMLNNYANIFGLIMQMRQVADHPDLILKKSSEGGQNVLVCCICDEPAEEAIRSRCRHEFCRVCAKSYINSQDQPDCPRCHIPLSIDLEQPEIEQDEVMVKKSSIINRIRMENWTSSSKIELLVHALHKLRSDNASHKSIIFSQFTSMLQLIEWRLRRAGITTVMLDGSMSPAQRQASINHFMTDVNVECFLVSLKAGGVALNLTEASRVFIVDPWWNPAAEWQSADRCHRIGQTRPCTITRLCIEDSVESRIVALQEKKANMINSTINSDDAAMESLTPEDLQFLFRGS